MTEDGDRKKRLPEAEELGEILDVINEKAPGIIAAIRDIIFSEEAGRDFGKAVGAFYKELVSSGIPSDEALKMAKDYIGSLQKAMSQVQGGWQGGPGSRSGHDRHHHGDRDETGAGEDE